MVLDIFAQLVSFLKINRRELSWRKTDDGDHNRVDNRRERRC